MKTILVVDDEADVTDVVTSALEDEGYRVLAACNGLEGLKCLSGATPDLLICDLMMPFMDGATLCQKIRDDPRHVNMRIVIASVMEPNALDTDFGGYDGFLRKPFHLVALLDLVSSVLNEQPQTAPHE